MLYEALYVPNGQPAFPREIIHEPWIRRYVEQWGLPDDLGCIALDGNIPIGAAWSRLFPEDNPSFGYVNPMTPEISIALSPEYRRRGTGSALLDRLFELAQERYASLSLSVSLENPARRLYERKGFQLIRQDGESLTMLKYLK
jgi:ribosomal protein S18 acetylase RimI-like enzyme